MRVLTLNTWLLPWAKGYFVRRRNIVDFLKSQSFDIINLQEVWFERDVKFFTENLKGYKHLSSGTKFFNRTGLLTLYKKKATKKEVHYFNGIKNYTLKERLVKRGYLYLRIRGLDIVNTHLIDFTLPWAKDHNKGMTKELEKFVGKKVLMTGDFNLDYKDMKKVKKFACVSKKMTWEKKNPYTIIKKDMKLDYVFYKGIKPIGHVMVRGFSDHNGIYAEFR